MLIAGWDRRGDRLSKKCLTQDEILEQLSILASDTDVAANYRIKALELLGKANKMFDFEEKEVIRAVKIVDDVP